MKCPDDETFDDESAVMNRPVMKCPGDETSVVMNRPMMNRPSDEISG